MDTPQVTLSRRTTLGLDAILRQNMVSSATLWFGVLSLCVSSCPAAAGWLPHIVLPGSALVTQPSSKHLNQLRTQNHSIIATLGSSLRPSDQCGGVGGLCNTTSIGIPCGDNAWTGADCPENYWCYRESQYIWRCKLIPGRNPGRQQSPHLPPREPPNNSSSREQLPHLSPREPPHNSSKVAQQPKQYSNMHSAQSSEDGTPIVPVCGPEHLAGRNTAMCNQTTDGFFANSTDILTSAAGVRLSFVFETCRLTVLLRLLLLLLSVLTGRAAVWS